MGEVNEPGWIPYFKDLTLSSAIRAAGGVTKFARDSAVEISYGRHTQIVDLNDAVANVWSDPPVFENSIIRVPSRRSGRTWTFP